MPDKPDRTGQYEERGEVRTDMHCHACSKHFIALLNFDLDGNHTVECPSCGHKHYRVIINGKVTSERWDSQFTEEQCHIPRRVWKADSLPAATYSASEFMRERWLNKSEAW